MTEEFDEELDPKEDFEANENEEFTEAVPDFDKDQYTEADKIISDKEDEELADIGPGINEGMVSGIDAGEDIDGIDNNDELVNNLIDQNQAEDNTRGAINDLDNEDDEDIEPDNLI